METWDIYNKNKEFTGRHRAKGTELKRDEYHLVAIVWIKTADGRFLISKRGKKETGAGLWETVGGSVMQGETSIEGAIREVNEEIGLTFTLNQMHFLKTVRHGDNGGWFADYWYVETDIDINQVVCQETEVEFVRWASRDEILDMINKNQFFHGKNHLEALFETGVL